MKIAFISLFLVWHIWTAECLQFRSIVNANRIQECFDLAPIKSNENDDVKCYHVEHFIYWAPDSCTLAKSDQDTWLIISTKRELAQIIRYSGEPLESSLWNVVKTIMIQAKVDPTGKTPMPLDFTT